MKKVIIIHGWSGSPRDNWLPWLKGELEKVGCEVVVPEMPDTDAPDVDKWISKLTEVAGAADAETYFVGHSVGCQAIIRYLQNQNSPVGGAVFVSGWFDLDNMEDEEEETIAKPWIETPVDFEKIKAVLLKSTLIISDNDPYGFFEKNKEQFAKLGAKEVVLHKAGHITDDEHQEILSEVLLLMK